MWIWPKQLFSDFLECTCYSFSLYIELFYFPCKKMLEDTVVVKIVILLKLLQKNPEIKCAGTLNL